jgi:glycerol-3-phosphate dehydrogenase (NAD(P)+)
VSDTVAILGAGAWGTALAVHLAGHREAPLVRLWARNRDAADAMRNSRINAHYLAGVRLPPTIEIVSDLDVAVANARVLIVATPIAGLEAVVDALGAVGVAAPLFWLGKGFLGIGRASGPDLAHKVLAPRWPQSVGVISGPSFAEEVARCLPTAVTVAATSRDDAERMAAVLRGPTFRAYVSDDLVGVEVGGAVKNVLAIAAGASDGLGFGNNARAALITRGLAETGRLSLALGGKRETLMGLAGLGDLVLTCTGDLSRNRMVGLALARGEGLEEILGKLGHVAEGVFAAGAIHTLANSLAIEMPICEVVYRVLHDGLAPRAAVQALLEREPARESQ